MKFLKELYPYVLVIIIVLLIRAFIVTPIRVDGSSMENTLYNGDVMLLNKLDNDFDRFEIVVINTENSSTDIIKRIIGTPGDTIEYVNNELYINDQRVEENFLRTETSDFSLSDIGYSKVPEGYYFVVGDNRNNSSDSRTIGLINEKDIEGTASFIIYPFNKFGNVK